jgi:hypothetical protein
MGGLQSAALLLLLVALSAPSGVVPRSAAKIGRIFFTDI